MIYQKVSSGLDFLDAEYGGLYANRCYYLRGPALSGRTTVSLQFLMAGLENGENCIMISSDRIENVILKSETIGLSLEQHLVDNRLILIEYPKEILNGQYQMGGIIHLLGEIERYVRSYQCSRIVFDSLMPLLLKAREPHLANYVYSLMNAIEALNVTALVTTNEPSSPVAVRISELIEDASAGSFSLSLSSPREGSVRQFHVHKMVNPLQPAVSYRLGLEYGTGCVQDFGKPEPVSTGTRGMVSAVSEVKTPSVSLSDLAMRIAVIDRETDTADQFEEIFPKAHIERFENDVEFYRRHDDEEFDTVVIRGGAYHAGWLTVTRTLREGYSKLPLFLVAEGLSGTLTYQSAKQAGADALFMKPLVKLDVIKALEKTLKGYNIYQDLVNRLVTKKRPSDLPEDFTSIPTMPVDLDVMSNEESLISLAEFRERLNMQTYRYSQTQEGFAVVSFRLINTGELTKLPQTPRGLELVKRVAFVIGTTMRGANDVACRSMDKIVVLLENCDREGADAFVARVTHDVKIDMQDRFGIQVGKHLLLSKAQALFPEESDNVQDLLHRVTESSRNFKLIS